MPESDGVPGSEHHLYEELPRAVLPRTEALPGRHLFCALYGDATEASSPRASAAAAPARSARTTL